MKPLTDLPSISRLSNRVIRILGCNPGFMTLQGTNTYLVGTGSRRILIDTGERRTATQYTKLLRQVLEEEKATIEHLLITHWHPDHIGGANSVQDLLRTISPAVTRSTIWKLPRAPDDKEPSEEEKSTNWEPLRDEQVLEVEGAKVRVHHTPGHSTDHATLFLDNEQALFSGDCILGERTAVFEDLHAYIQSLRKILELQPQVIYPGHGAVIHDSVSSIKFYIEHRLRRENTILEILAENSKSKAMSEMDIAKHMYTDNANIMWEAAAYNVEHHLLKLLREGKVKGEKGKWQSI
ncbi:endoribonuclease LACTB2 [Andrena cerasifolii]|uniref:endoribonuclease LACTB2 n=1 Tax=Andrena cerasifolii TaxID=2819439 RepID=UPI004037F830